MPHKQVKIAKLGEYGPEKSHVSIPQAVGAIKKIE
jgi:hypothetical protein